VFTQFSAALILFVLLIFGVLAILIGTKNRTRMGINRDSVVCPNCHTPIKSIRKPNNFRQALWGGATCSKCSCEIDKWGREIE